MSTVPTISPHYFPTEKLDSITEELVGVRSRVTTLEDQLASVSPHSFLILFTQQPPILTQQPSILTPKDLPPKATPVIGGST